MSDPEIALPRRHAGVPLNEGSGRRTVALIAAVCITFAAIWSYIFLNQKPPVAAGVMTQLAGVPVHTQLRQNGSAQQGVGGGVEVQDQVLVLLNTTIRNTTHIPIFPFEQTGTLTLSTGEQKQARALSAVDMMRAFRAYPSLAAAHTPMLGPALQRQTTLKPGEAEHGLVLFSFPINAEDWESRRGFDLEVPIRWQQRNLVIPQPAPKP